MAVSACAAALLGASPALAKPMPPPPPDDPGQGGPYAEPPPPYQQPPPPPEQAAPERFERNGWFLGFGLDVGPFGRENDDYGYGGAALRGVFGGMVSPRIGLFVELAAGAYAISDEDRYVLCGYDCNAGWSVAGLGIGGQFWATDKLWLRASLGSRHLAFTIEGDTGVEEEGRSFSGAIGYEIMRRTSFALDLSFGVTTISMDRDSAALGQFGAGFSWY